MASSPDFNSTRALLFFKILPFRAGSKFTNYSSRRQTKHPRGRSEPWSDDRALLCPWRCFRIWILPKLGKYPLRKLFPPFTTDVHAPRKLSVKKRSRIAGLTCMQINCQQFRGKRHAGAVTFDIYRENRINYLLY